MAEHYRAEYSRVPNFVLWFFAEIAIVACDIPEVSLYKPVVQHHTIFKGFHCRHMRKSNEIVSLRPNLLFFFYFYFSCCFCVFHGVVGFTSV